AYLIPLRLPIVSPESVFQIVIVPGKPAEISFFPLRENAMQFTEPCLISPPQRFFPDFKSHNPIRPYVSPTATTSELGEKVIAETVQDCVCNSARALPVRASHMLTE